MRYKSHKDIIIDKVINDTADRTVEFIMDEITINNDRKDESVMDEPSTTANQEKVVTVINIDDLVDFKEQPFKPYADAELDKLAESIKTHGVMEPILVRPYKGQYQIISGHNRVLACKKLGRTEIHAIVEEMDDDTATLRMVDANFKQRQGLSISERASAYKLVLDIHQKPGNRTDLDDDKQPRDKVDTRSIRASDIIGSNENRSGRTISRLVRLTELTKEFLADVDARKLGTTTAEALSYLTKKEQNSLHSLLKKLDTGITLEQARELKKSKEDNGELSTETMLEILTTEKLDEQAKISTIKFPYKDVAHFFAGEDLRNEEDINKRLIEILTEYFDR